MAQDAQRLAALGLSASEIGRRLDINKSTVTRWMKAGKLGPSAPGRSVVAGAVPKQSPEEWANAVRADYALDATDEQLVTMAEAVLMIAHDPRESTQAKLGAMARFQGIVKQLALVARNLSGEQPGEPKAPEPERPPMRVIRRPAEDPRHVLQAVK